MIGAQVVIFAHNEERRIAGCINSLPLTSDTFEFHLLVNGTTDQTAAIARGLTGHFSHFHIHDLPEGGKARTWNHFVDHLFDEAAPAVLFVDGDAEVVPGALEAMVETLAANPQANGVNALPLAGRKQDAYREQMLEDHGLFGALYGLGGAFLNRLKASGIRLPLDLIGDDGLIAALAKTSLQDESHWDKTRIANCPAARFRFEVADWRVPATWGQQWRRMVNYSVRRYQNMIISNIMRGPGPAGLPATMRETYAAHMHLFDIRAAHAPFDWLAKRRIENTIR
jgi:glycosyltransferase involved in cell wall biosynthesis